MTSEGPDQTALQVQSDQSIRLSNLVVYGSEVSVYLESVRRMVVVSHDEIARLLEVTRHGYFTFI